MPENDNFKERSASKGMNTNPKKQWHLLFDAPDPLAMQAVSELSEALNVTPTTAKLLYLRGYRTVAEAKRFFRLEEAEPHDPFLLRDMRRAVDRVNQAVKNRERIAVYGDYDVDGIIVLVLKRYRC